MQNYSEYLLLVKNKVGFKKFQKAVVPLNNKLTNEIQPGYAHRGKNTGKHKHLMSSMT